MKALTVQQPWAWAIVHAAKSPENRSRNVAGDYRGPLAIHASLTTSPSGMRDPRVRDAWRRHGEGDPLAALVLGAIIGVVDLVGVHRGPNTETDSHRAVGSCFQIGRPYGLCTRWAEVDAVHLVLENPRPLDRPVPCRGALGLWTPPDDVLAQVRGQLAADRAGPGPATGSRSGNRFGSWSGWRRGGLRAASTVPGERTDDPGRTT